MSFRFGLKTAFCVVTLCVILVAFFAIFENHSNDDIVGDWYYCDGSFKETLLINADGTFSKFEQYKWSTIAYSGKYAISEKGIIAFYSQKRVEGCVEIIDIESQCRFAIDSAGFLIFYELDKTYVENQPIYRVPRWHCYEPTLPESKRLGLAIKQAFEEQCASSELKRKTLAK